MTANPKPLVRWMAAGALACELALAGPVAARSAALDGSALPFVTTSVVPGFPERVERAGELLNERDRAAFKEAYDAAERRSWSTARTAAARIGHPVAKKLITWAYLTDDETEPTFDEVMRFLGDNPDWPLQDEMLMKAEKALPPGMPAQRLIAWFAGQEPLTGDGMVRLGEAYLATGEKDFGKRWIALAWASHDFSDTDQATLWLNHQDVLRGRPSIDRMEHLLWSYQFTQAEWLLPQVPAEQRRVAEARIALMKSSSSAMTLVRALPRDAQEDPGVVFDQVRYLRRQGNDEEAQRLLINLKDPDNAPYPEKWWIERNVQARQAMEDRHYDIAYKLLAHTGLTSGEAFADAEWLAGWIALRDLNKPEAALGHFQKLERGVTFPISLARAHYWAGRAAEAMGDKAVAATAYEAAAAIPYTFYGQLAAESPLLTGRQLQMPATPTASSETFGTFLSNELVTAIRLLGEIDGDRYMRTLAYEIGDAASTEDNILLADLLRTLNQPAISLRIAKRASQKGILLTDYLFPVVELPDYAGRGTPPEPALVMGLMRQESEFNPKAVSSAGARGIMQLIPSTARITASKHGLPYRPDALATDATYNAQLGMAHVSDLIERFEGSYILTIAAYNAGPNRADQWVAAFGDPRTARIDPIDWIETIPFAETRNYVQRVLENAAVYRHRIARRPVAFAMNQDLRRTSSTPVDLSYTLPASGPVSSEVAAAEPPTPPAETPAPEGAAPAAPQAVPAVSQLAGDAQASRIPTPVPAPRGIDVPTPRPRGGVAEAANVTSPVQPVATPAQQPATPSAQSAPSTASATPAPAASVQADEIDDYVPKSGKLVPGAPPPGYVPSTLSAPAQDSDAQPHGYVPKSGPVPQGSSAEAQPASRNPSSATCARLIQHADGTRECVE